MILFESCGVEAQVAIPVDTRAKASSAAKAALRTSHNHIEKFSPMLLRQTHEFC